MGLVVSQEEKLEDRRTSASCQGERLKQSLALRIGQERLDLWFGASSEWEFDHNKATIFLESPFLADCVRSFCWDDLRAVVSEMGNDATRIQLSVKASLKSNGSPRPADGKMAASPASLVGAPSPVAQTNAPMILQSTTAETTNRGESPMAISAGAPRAGRSGTETEWWRDFVPGASSRLATTAVEMLLERPGTLSPLVIHGPNGSGKTHLARAIAEQLRRRCGLRRTIVMTAEQFTIDYTESARGAGFASFRKKYRDVDAFILDDLQFLVGKNATLAELRNTIDNLLRERRQIVLTSDRSLHELNGLGSDLCARIAGGMACSLEPLDPVTRRALLGNLMAKHQIPLSDQTAEYLAESAGGDGRALYGIAFRLMTEQRRLGRPLTHEEAVAASLDLIRACQPVVRLADIERVVCENFRLDPKILQAKGKGKQISAPRMLAMFLARKHTRAAYSEIGDYFGKRQHSTVISAQKKVVQWIEGNENLPHANGTIAVRELLRHLERSLQVG